VVHGRGYQYRDASLGDGRPKLNLHPDPRLVGATGCVGYAGDYPVLLSPDGGTDWQVVSLPALPGQSGIEWGQPTQTSSSAPMAASFTSARNLGTCWRRGLRSGALSLACRPGQPAPWRGSRRP
jgi:hypothetical protein